MFRLESRFPINRPRKVAVLAPASAAFACAAMALFILLMQAIKAVIGEEAFPPKPAGTAGTIPLSAICFELFVFWAVVAGAYALRKLSLLHDKERELGRLALEKARSEAGLRAAELEALRMRLKELIGT